MFMFLFIPIFPQIIDDVMRIIYPSGCLGEINLSQHLFYCLASQLCLCNKWTYLMWKLKGDCIFSGTKVYLITVKSMSDILKGKNLQSEESWQRVWLFFEAIYPDDFILLE